MSSREVVVWLDERRYDALSRQLKNKDTTICRTDDVKPHCQICQKLPRTFLWVC